MPIKISKKSFTVDPNRLPPQDIEAEQSVLGSLLIDKDAIVKIADIIAVEDFYRKSHEMIFKAILELYQKNEPIDLLTVSSHLKEKKEFKEIGGMSYLTTLMNFVPTASNVVYYAKIVNQKKVLRDLISASHEINSLAYEEHKNIDELLDEAEKKIFGVVGPIIGVSGVLLGLGKMRDLKAISLLAETFGHPMFLGIKGAKELLRVLEAKFSLGIDIKKMSKEIIAVEKELMEKTQEWTEEMVANQAGAKVKKKEAEYIG